jgi:hypothetical protein
MKIVIVKLLSESNEPLLGICSCRVVSSTSVACKILSYLKYL